MSNAIGHRGKINFDGGYSRHRFFHACINKCEETLGCVAITFREASKACQLEHSIGYLPTTRKQHSYLDMSCLSQPGYELYTGYKENITGTLEKFCPDGFQNWIPLSPQCYKLEVSSYPTTHKMAAKVCQKFKSQLVLIDSKELNDVYVKEIARKEPEHDGVRIGWRLGTSTEIHI